MVNLGIATIDNCATITTTTPKKEAKMIWRKVKNKLLAVALVISIVAFILVMTSTIDLTMMGSLLYSVWIVVLIVWLSIRFVDNRRKKRELEADGSFEVPPEFREKGEEENHSKRNST